MTFNVSQEGCITASVNEEGKIRKYPPEEQEFHNYYLLKCLMQGNIKLFEYTIPYPDPYYLYPDDPRHTKVVDSIIKEANQANIKMLRVENLDKNRPDFYVAFINDSERINALLFKYIVNVMKLQAVKQGSGEVTWVAYAFGVLFHYPEEDIRGYFLREYLVLSPPIKYDKVFHGLTSDPYVNIDEAFEARRDYIERLDGFAEFDRQFQAYKREATTKLKRIASSKKFKEFAKREAKNIFDYHGNTN